MAQGGHDVPVDKVIDRRRRSFTELAWFVQCVDQCTIFDNSVGDPQLIATKSGDKLVQLADLPPDLDATLRAEGVTPVDARE